jgi:release factor H-coupled RctB family protein
MGNSLTGPASRSISGGPIHHFYTKAAWIDGRAEQQLTEVAALPGMVAVAGYPDLHPGLHGPVGAAFLADRLYTQLVGNDIGCGMALFALYLPLRKLSLEKAARRLRVLEGPWADAPEEPGLGTIGGGNHFCEVQAVESLSEAGAAAGLEKALLCLLVHFGSRGLGEAVYRASVGLSAQGLDPDSPAGREYLAAHDRAVTFARRNRLAIATRAAQALNADLQLVADAPHNLLQTSGDLWLHRKGAAVAGSAGAAGRVARQLQLSACPDQGC